MTPLLPFLPGKRILIPPFVYTPSWTPSTPSLLLSFPPSHPLFQSWTKPGITKRWQSSTSFELGLGMQIRMKRRQAACSIPAEPCSPQSFAKPHPPSSITRPRPRSAAFLRSLRPQVPIESLTFNWSHVWMEFSSFGFQCCFWLIIKIILHQH